MSLFNDFLGNVRAPVLLEALNYADMFNDVTKVVGERPKLIDATITKARAGLRKNDRVVWYLRLWKIGFVEELLQTPAYAEKADPRWLPKLISDYTKRSEMSTTDVKTVAWTLYRDNTFVTTMEHYLSLPVPEVQNKVFSFDDPERVLAEFRAVEKKWQEEAKDAFQDDEAEVVMTFPNGLAWYNLNRAACSKEAKAMGHCGNSPRAHTGDTILSLRKPMKRGEVTLHKPLLTFILHDNGMLGEMKGRFNEKPEAQFHNEIVALLRSDMVEGIKGGGYQPQNNFSMNDLPYDVREELIEEKPGLAGLYEIYQSKGIEDPMVMDMLREKLAEYNAVPSMLELSDNKREFKIDQWKNLDAFCREIDDGIVRKLIEIAEGESEEFESFDELNAEEISAVISHLHDTDYHKLMRALQVRPVPHNHEHFQKAVLLATHRVLGSAYYDMMVDAANTSTAGHALKLKARKRIDDYIEAGWGFSNHWVWVSTPEGLDDPITLHINVDDMVSLATADTDGDSEYAGYLSVMNNDGGWTGISDYMSENRSEKGLSTAWGYKADIRTDSEFKAAPSGGAFDPVLIGRAFMKEAFHKSSYSGLSSQADLFKR